MNPEDDRFGRSLNRRRGPNVPIHVAADQRLDEHPTKPQLTKTSNLIFTRRRGVSKIGITTDGVQVRSEIAASTMDQVYWRRLFVC